MADPTNEAFAAEPPKSDERELVFAGSAQDAIEAELLRATLEEAGIEALIEEARGGMVEKLSNPSEAWALRVPAPDVARARQLIEEHRAAMESDPEGGSRAAEAAEAEEEAASAAQK